MRVSGHNHRKQLIYLDWSFAVSFNFAKASSKEDRSRKVPCGVIGSQKT